MPDNVPNTYHYLYDQSSKLTDFPKLQNWLIHELNRLLFEADKIVTEYEKLLTHYYKDDFKKWNEGTNEKEKV